MLCWYQQRCVGTSNVVWVPAMLCGYQQCCVGTTMLSRYRQCWVGTGNVVWVNFTSLKQVLHPSSNLRKRLMFKVLIKLRIFTNVKGFQLHMPSMSIFFKFPIKTTIANCIFCAKGVVIVCIFQPCGRRVDHGGERAHRHATAAQSGQRGQEKVQFKIPINLRTPHRGSMTHCNTFLTWDKPLQRIVG